MGTAEGLLEQRLVDVVLLQEVGKRFVALQLLLLTKIAHQRGFALGCERHLAEGAIQHQMSNQLRQLALLAQHRHHFGG